jgi:hypothetical protein
MDELEPPAPAPDEMAPEPEPEPEILEEPREEAPPPAPAPRPKRPGFLSERPEEVERLPRGRLAAQSRRDFLLFGLGTLATASAAWWLLPDRTKARLLPGPWRDRLDTLAMRVGLTPERREATLDQALTFDDDVAEALYSRHRRVR